MTHQIFHDMVVSSSPFDLLCAFCALTIYIYCLKTIQIKFRKWHLSGRKNILCEIFVVRTQKFHMRNWRLSISFQVLGCKVLDTWARLTLRLENEWSIQVMKSWSHGQLQTGCRRNRQYNVLGTALPGFRSCNPPWLRLSEKPWDPKPLRRHSISLTGALPLPTLLHPGPQCMTR